MTDKDIIKAFKCCNLVTYSCADCPFYKDEKCTANNIGNIEKTIADILDRQQAEIEQYKARILNDTEYLEKLEVENRKQQAEIERLEKLLAVTVKAKNDYANQLEQVIKNLKTAKAEAIREFAERLKERKQSICAGHGLTEYAVSEFDIDNLVKEMVGEQE